MHLLSLQIPLGNSPSRKLQNILLHFPRKFLRDCLWKIPWYFPHTFPQLIPSDRSVKDIHCGGVYHLEYPITSIILQVFDRQHLRTPWWLSGKGQPAPSVSTNLLALMLWPNSHSI